MTIFKLKYDKDTCDCTAPKLVDFDGEKFICLFCEKEVKIHENIKN